MTLTQEEINRYKDWMEGLWKDINSKKPYSEKKYLQQMNNIPRRKSCCDNNYDNKRDNYYANAPNYYNNYYSSNNVYITGNNVGKVGYLF